MKRSRTNRNHARPNAFFEPLEDRRLMSAPGDLDLSFGSAGKAGADFGNGLTGVAEDVAVQSDGKTVVAGYAYKMNGTSPQYYIALARFNVNGSPDTTFGPDRFGRADGKVLTSVADLYSAQGHAVVIQPDGKILVAGEARSGGDSTIAVVRYNTNGTLDSSFHSDGKATVRINDASRGYDLALQKDGKIVVVGTDYNGFFDANFDFAAIRLLSNGSLDSSFDGDGKITIGLGENERAYAVAIDYTGTPTSNRNYGKIVLAGEYRTDNGSQLAMARLTAGGSLDYDFHQGGKLRTPIGSHTWSRASGIMIQPNGRAVVTGTGGDDNSPGSYQFAMARYDSSGWIDQSFGTAGNGMVETGFGGADTGFDVVRSSDGGLIVGGSVNRQLALAKYDSIGRLDTRFGAGGKVKLDVGDIQGGAGIAAASDGRIVLAGGTGFTTARFYQAVPEVNIINGDRDATEQPGNNGSLVIMRDSDYDFPTRVYLDFSGNATFNQDYTSTLTRVQPIVSGGRVALRLNPGNIVGGLFQNQAYIDIPAGQMFVTVPIDAVNDSILEPAETATFALAANSRYSVGAFNTRSVTIADNDGFQVNFQTAGSLTFAGPIIADYGLAFGNRGGGLSFGWDADNTANARVRHNPGSLDFRYDTLNHMQKNGANRTWELAVPNGLYQVTLIAGDPSNTDAVYKMNLENTLAVSGTPAGDTRWFYSTVRVQVNDGRLTLNNAAGAVNNRVCFLDITAAPPNTTPGPVVSNVPVKLFTGAQTMPFSSVPRRPLAGIFSSNLITGLV
jgi:uncharacterized delta-60 repeat protein